MSRVVRLLLCAVANLALTASPALAAKRPGFDPSARAASSLTAFVRGPLVWPGHVAFADEAGRLRTLELDDTAPLHLRLSIPF